MAEVTNRIDSQQVSLSSPESYKMHPNLAVELQRLISQILAQSGRIAENNNKKTETTKRDFQKFSAESAKWIRKEGNMGPWTAAISLAFRSAACFQLKDSNREGLCKFVSEYTPQVTSMVTSKYRSEQTLASNNASLKLQEYTSASNNKQFDSELRQACMQMLKEAQETETKAATAR